MRKRLIGVKGLPPAFVRACEVRGMIEILDLVDWMDTPDQNGRTGPMKLRKLPMIGPQRAVQIEEIFAEYGIDISR